jgi:hypothetical protein
MSIYYKVKTAIMTGNGADPRGDYSPLGYLYESLFKIKYLFI